MGWDLTIVAAALLGFAAVSGRLHRSVITPAMVFVLLGYLLGDGGLGVFDSGIDPATVRLLAEVTLALVLFSDAAALDSRALSREAALPARLLAIGLPLSIVLGTVVAWLLFPDLLFFEAVVLAVLLAPTDAALGQTVISDRRLPSRLRQGLNVESGLNDGICVPLLFAAIALATVEETAGGEVEILRDLLIEISVALVVGLATAVSAAALFTASGARGWLDHNWAQVVPLATAAVAYTATVELGGSGFIAAFVAGIVYGRRVGPSSAHHSTKLMEELGGLLSAVTFFVFGAVLIARSVTDLDIATVAYALASLTVVRMAPVALSLLGSRASWQTSAFAGWFGPRGLATIVFMLTVVEESQLAGTSRIVQVATVTVLFSVIAHGVSAPGLTERYVRWYDTSRHSLALESRRTGVHVADRRGLWHRNAQHRGRPDAGEGAEPDAACAVRSSEAAVLDGDLEP